MREKTVSLTVKLRDLESLNCRRLSNRSECKTLRFWIFYLKNHEIWASVRPWDEGEIRESHEETVRLGQFLPIVESDCHPRTAPRNGWDQIFSPSQLFFHLLKNNSPSVCQCGIKRNPPLRNVNLAVRGESEHFARRLNTEDVHCFFHYKYYSLASMNFHASFRCSFVSKTHTTPEYSPNNCECCSRKQGACTYDVKRMNWAWSASSNEN